MLQLHDDDGPSFCSIIGKSWEVPGEDMWSAEVCVNLSASTFASVSVVATAHRVLFIRCFLFVCLLFRPKFFLPNPCRHLCSGV